MFPRFPWLSSWRRRCCLKYWRIFWFENYFYCFFTAGPVINLNTKNNILVDWAFILMSPPITNKKKYVYYCQVHCHIFTKTIISDKISRAPRCPKRKLIGVSSAEHRSVLETNHISRVAIELRWESPTINKITVK